MYDVFHNEKDEILNYKNTKSTGRQSPGVLFKEKFRTTVTCKEKDSHKNCEKELQDVNSNLFVLFNFRKCSRNLYGRVKCDNPFNRGVYFPPQERIHGNVYKKSGIYAPLQCSRRVLPWPRHTWSGACPWSTSRTRGWPPVAATRTRSGIWSRSCGSEIR